VQTEELAIYRGELPGNEQINLGRNSKISLFWSKFLESAQFADNSGLATS